MSDQITHGFATPEFGDEALACRASVARYARYARYPLAGMIKTFDPLPGAKYVRFESMYTPSDMPGQKLNILPWPYVEGLRLDEAMHPLTLMVTGLVRRGPAEEHLAGRQCERVRLLCQRESRG
jgi:hypothetical protein